jgi:hypothetical protein
LLQKERKERMALMPDEDFEGDFLEMQELPTLQVRFFTDSISGLPQLIVQFVCVCNKLKKKNI